MSSYIAKIPGSLKGAGVPNPGNFVIINLDFGELR
jgi:hypothetical protein